MCQGKGFFCQVIGNSVASKSTNIRRGCLFTLLQSQVQHKSSIEPDTTSLMTPLAGGRAPDGPVLNTQTRAAHS